MSVQSQIDRIEQNVANTYAVLAGLGADMPTEQNSDNLAATAGTAKAVLYSVQTLTEAQKAQARANIGIIGTGGGASVIPEFVNSIEECIDPEKLYVLPDGYIYAYMEHTEEVVIPGETVTIPAKAALQHFKRYSLSSDAWKPVSSSFDSIVLPFDASGNQTRTIKLIGMTRPKTFKEVYAGHSPNNFDFQPDVTESDDTTMAIDCSQFTEDFQYIVFNINTLNQQYDGIGLTLDGVTVDIVVTTDPTVATPSSTITTEGTTETIVTKGFASTGHKFVSTVNVKQKNRSIRIDSTVQALESSVSMTIPQLKKNKTIAFSGVYTGSITEISVIQGEGSGLLECKCVVTPTSITVLKNGSQVYTANHGVTFDGYFSLVLTTGNLNNTKAYLSSGGGSFTSSEFLWATSRREVKLYTNVPFSQYQLSYGSNDFSKEIWLYGDSYFDHWLPLSINRGYTNCLADGYSGAASSSGLTSLRTAIKHGTPAKIVWCLGMNNGDKGVINQSWLDCITEVKGICDANNIELWVSTIPNTPTVDNTYKNAYIRENFDHVIDLSKLVGAEDSTAWYTGLLSSDNVHPSTEGDFYIANIMETYFPEMLDM